MPIILFYLKIRITTSVTESGKKRIESLGNDVWGIWANRLANRYRMLIERMWTFYSIIKCFYWKINFGSGCRFWGRMHFRRAPNSTIQIGKFCRFRSATWSNMVGINRPCTLCTLRPNAKITIGNNSGFSGTVISAAKSITIGDNVLSGANVTITDTDWHHIDRSMEGKEDAPCAPVTIGNNVWLGMGVTILKGVKVGNNSVIAVNSIVNRDIPESVLAGGQPAKILKRL